MGSAHLGPREKQTEEQQGAEDGREKKAERSGDAVLQRAGQVDRRGEGEAQVDGLKTGDFAFCSRKNY